MAWMLPWVTLHENRSEKGPETWCARQIPRPIGVVKIPTECPGEAKHLPRRNGWANRYFSCVGDQRSPSENVGW